MLSARLLYSGFIFTALQGRSDNYHSSLGKETAAQTIHGLSNITQPLTSGGARIQTPGSPASPREQENPPGALWCDRQVQRAEGTSSSQQEASVQGAARVPGGRCGGGSGSRRLCKESLLSKTCSEILESMSHKVRLLEPK